MRSFVCFHLFAGSGAYTVEHLAAGTMQQSWSYPLFSHTVTSSQRYAYLSTLALEGCKICPPLLFFRRYLKNAARWRTATKLCISDSNPVPCRWGSWLPLPSGFSSIAQKRRRAAPPFLVYLFGHLFHALCQNLSPRSRATGQVEWPKFKKKIAVVPQRQWLSEWFETFRNWYTHE